MRSRVQKCSRYILYQFRRAVASGLGLSYVVNAARAGRWEESTNHKCGIHLDHQLAGKSYEGKGLYRVKKNNTPP
jgi:hypothetical protein